MTSWGINTLHESPVSAGQDRPYVDIVGIHGLGSDQNEAWTHSQTGTIWLRDLLPFDSLPSRVLTFGYRADARTFFGNDSANRVLQHAHTLIAELVAIRDMSDTTERPIIFVCHGLGGILVKRALAHSATQTSNKVDHLYSIFISTYGILFLGTPHNGMDHAACQFLAEGINFKIGIPSQLTSVLTKNSETLQNITDQFAPLMKQFHIYFFWEGVETNLGSLKGYIVPEDSAAPIIDNTERTRIHATHAQMCKFSDPDSTDFRIVLAAIYRYAREAHSTIRPRWVNARKFLATQRSIEASELIGFDAHNHNAPFLCESPKLYQGLAPRKIRNRYFHVPHNVSSIFTGRDAVNQVLHDSILGDPKPDTAHQQKRFVLYGLGGSGKTQFCLKFVQDNRDRFWGIFWVDASSVENAESTLAQLGRLGGLDESYVAGMHWLTGLENPWLLVIDNADDPLVDYSKFFPAGNRGHILLTTRNAECTIHATAGSYEFNDMDEEDAISLLLKAAQAQDLNDSKLRTVARPIVKTLGCLPLALIQAGASIRQGICSLEDYLEIFASYKKQVMNDRLIQGADSYRYTVYSTWEVSVQMIERLSSETAKDAIQILQILAFLHFEHVPIIMFERVWNIMQDQKQDDAPMSFSARVLEVLLSFAIFAKIFAILSFIRIQYSQQQLPGILLQKGSTWNVIRFRQAVGMLSRFSLINKDKSSDAYSMHPMVHYWARERLNQYDQIIWSNVATTVLAGSITSQLEASGQPYRRSLLPHIDACFQREKLPVPHTHPTAPRRSESILQRLSGPKEVSKLVKFAAIYSECGHWAKAIDLQERVLEVRRETMGHKHPETLQAMMALSWSYWNFRRPSEALVLQRKVVDSSSESLGTEDPRTLKAMDTLAATYWLCGKRSEAENLGEKAMDGLILKLGPGHPDSLTAMENLGRTYMHRGRPKAAQKLQAEVLVARSKMYGPSHPDTLMAMANLGMSYHALGDLTEAEKYLEAVTEVRKQVLGQEHAYTLWAINDLSKIYVDQGHASEAEELLTGILEIVTRTLGKEHIGMSMTLMNLARALNGQGKWADGQTILTDLIAMQQRTLGPEHPDTLAAKVELTRSLRYLGCLADAEKMLVEAIEKMTRIMGADHTWTQKAMGQLSAIYIGQGRLDEASRIDSRLQR